MLTRRLMLLGAAAGVAIPAALSGSRAKAATFPLTLTDVQWKGRLTPVQYGILRKADTIFLAVPFGEHREIARVLPSWEGKTFIDAMNSFPVPPEELDGLPSSAFVAKSFPGAKVVKGFNHLAAATLATNPAVDGGHRVAFLSSDDEEAVAPVEDLAKQLGFAPVKLGKLNEGGWLVHARGRTWGPLIFQDLFKKQQ